MMPFPKTLGRLYLILIFSAIACAGDGSAAKTRDANSVKKSDGDETQMQSASVTIQSFNVVEGSDLMTKLESAQAKARARQTPYWSAYAFDVRPGVAVDAAFHGGKQLRQSHRRIRSPVTIMPAVQRPLRSIYRYIDIQIPACAKNYLLFP